MFMAQVKAPIAAVIKEIKKSIGDKIQDDTVVMLCEAMKVEYPVFAECEGIISELKVSVGEAVELNQVLMEVNPD